MAERVIVAMSGGVDSSVAAARLVRGGFEVVGVTLHLWDYPDDGGIRGRCCAPEDVHDARRVADQLGFPHYAFDRRQLFLKEVVEPFVDAYLEGQTPSPCVRCNRGVKLNELVHLADRLGAVRVATGHYARLENDGKSTYLLRGRDHDKDQSYFLHMLPQSVLDRLEFPLGESTKAEVRLEAQALRLHGADKGESQELCFVPRGRYTSFVEARAPDRLRPGPIVDARGAELGRHSGVHSFTIGQRKNLGVSLGRRAFVVDIDAASGAVVLGSREELLATGAIVVDARLCPDVVPPFSADVRVRYRADAVRAEIVPRPDGALEVVFVDPVAAVVPGQYAVFYCGERVLGGGLIHAAVHGTERGLS